MNRNILQHHNSPGYGSGSKLKKAEARPIRSFTVACGAISGSVLLMAAGLSEPGGHEWQMSHDGINWIPLLLTLRATTVVSGLEPGATVYFRHRAFTRDVVQEWSEAMKVIIR